MRRDFERWPSIVMIDGTYKLTNQKLTVMLLVIEDPKGRGQVIGVGLLSTEEKETFRWMMEAFQEENRSLCHDITSFMSDKDLTARPVLHQLFPNVPTYICRFHVIKTFKKIVNEPEMKLLKCQKKQALTILENLCYTRSDKHYQQLYNLLRKVCPSQLIQYYDQNWHNIRDEWFAHKITKCNLGNYTNNRTESINGKIKQVVKKTPQGDSNDNQRGKFLRN